MNSLDKTTNLSTLQASAGDASSSPTQSHDAEIVRLTELIRSQNSTLKSQEIKIQALIQEVAYLRRMRYGVKNEAMSAEQRSLAYSTPNPPPVAILNQPLVPIPNQPPIPIANPPTACCNLSLWLEAYYQC